MDIKGEQKSLDQLYVYNDKSLTNLQVPTLYDALKVFENDFKKPSDNLSW